MYRNLLYFSQNLILDRLADSGDELYNLASSDVY